MGVLFEEAAAGFVLLGEDGEGGSGGDGGMVGILYHITMGDCWGLFGILNKQNRSLLSKTTPIN